MKWEDTALSGLPMRGCLEPACPGPEGWRAMVYAPRDGAKVELLIEHRTWWTAHKCSPDEARIWRAICEGQWVDHNGGGWTWAGMSGTPIGWRPLKTPNVPVSRPQEREPKGHEDEQRQARSCGSARLAG